jgi:hypothetical protein
MPVSIGTSVMRLPVAAKIALHRADFGILVT